MPDKTITLLTPEERARKRKLEAAPRMFPVLGKRPAGIPRYVPWAMLAPFEHQAIYNHDQTLQRLAERGGLGFDEMAAVLSGKRWQWARETDAATLAQIVLDALKAWRTDRLAQLEAENETLRNDYVRLLDCEETLHEAVPLLSELSEHACHVDTFQEPPCGDCPPCQARALLASIRLPGETP